MRTGYRRRFSPSQLPAWTKNRKLPPKAAQRPESRSSSPVRVLRDGERQSALRGLYPCGEGAGYAGGIVSAAVDGIRCAEAVLKGESDEHV